MIPDRAFLARERVLLDRLEMGLADEGYRPFHALPVDSGSADEPSFAARPDDLPGVYSTTVPYAARGLPLTLGLRVSALAQRLESLTAGDESSTGGPLVDVVHAFGLGSWPFAGSLARRVGARLVLEVFSSRMASHAVRAAALAGSRGVDTRLVAVDESLVRVLNESAGRAGSSPRITLAPWGVHVPARCNDWSLPKESTSVVMLGSGAEPEAVRAAIEGLALVAPSIPELMLFVGADLTAAVPVFAWAQRAGLEHRLAVLPTIEGQRDLAVQCDLLLLPEASGEHRTFTLEAMASGMVVIARGDPFASHLIEAQTAHIVTSPQPAGFAAAIASIMHSTPRAAALAASARDFVQHHRLASSYVGRVLEAYRGS